MSDPKLDRFRRLERPRAPGEAPPARSPATDTRIEAVEGPAAAPAGAGAPASGGSLGRFRAPAERELELDRAGQDDQPFLRCAACETDNFRTAAACTTCGADLDTGPQREFNRRFWAGRRAEAAAEARAGAERQAALEAAQAEQEAARRRMGEEIAREVGASERRRLEQDGLGEGWGGRADQGLTGWLGGSTRPWAFRLLASLPSGWAIGIGLLLLALPFVLYRIHPVAGLVAGAVLVILFTPPGWRTRRRWGGWWD